MFLRNIVWYKTHDNRIVRFAKYPHVAIGVHIFFTIYSDNMNLQKYELLCKALWES